MDLKPAHLKRYGNVVRLLVKYGNPGAGRVDDSLPGDPALPPDDESAALGAELAKDLESLGPTFIKLGQLLSSASPLALVLSIVRHDRRDLEASEQRRRGAS